MSPPTLFTLDFETYYNKEYNLTRLTTEAYIRDPRFQIIGVSVKRGFEPAQWRSYATMEEYQGYLQPLSQKFVCAHNMAFDGAILGWRLDIHPRFLFDTLSMARPEFQMTQSLSLKALAERLTLGAKGTEVVQALGKRREDFTQDELNRYGEYCKNDVELTHLLFRILQQGFPTVELKIIDMLLRMFTQPRLELDVDVLQEHLSSVREGKAAALALVDQLCSKNDLMSNQKFADVLRGLGVEPPMKVSLTTGKPTFAFSKTDTAFKELLEHENPFVQAAVGARLGVKSTIEETRTLTFLDIALRGPLPVPLKYYGAHTGRVSGAEGSRLNMTNLPRGGKLRRAVKAPPGHKLVVGDSSQIEARIVAWLAEERELVQAFARGEDIYSQFASKVYGRPVDRKRKLIDVNGKPYAPDELEGFVGKTCVAEGTMLLCKLDGEVVTLPIEQFTTDYQLWDGEDWVWARGMVSNGLKETLQLCGAWLTPDHLVLSGTQWKEAQFLEHDAHTLSQALERAAESLPLLGTSKALAAESKHLSLRAAVGAQNTLSTDRTSKSSKQPGVLYVPERPQHGRGNCTGDMLKSSLTTRIEQDCSIGWRQRLVGATSQPTPRTSIMDSGGLSSAPNGERTGRPSCDTSLRYLDGTTQNTNSTESTATADMPQETSVLRPEARTFRTSEASEHCRTGLQHLRKKLPVYDITDCGPRNRFTIITEAGPLIVHNCILGLGFGMGHLKFQGTLKASKTPVIIDDAESQRIVTLYRNTYPKIARLWKTGDKALYAILAGSKMSFGPGGLLETSAEGILLPNGMLLRYPNLTLVDGGFVYSNCPRQATAIQEMRRTNQWDQKKVTHIYAGKVIENCVQALARIVVMDQALAISKRYPAVHTVYDDIMLCVPEAEAGDAATFMEDEMSKAPAWAVGLPIACEVGVGKNYADAK